MHPNIAKLLNDPGMFKKKIFIPHHHNINFVGLLIGPKGMYQKKLEEESGCKIFIRGK
jgi:transcription antitermination factor NusA-like protein